MATPGGLCESSTIKSIDFQPHTAQPNKLNSLQARFPTRPSHLSLGNEYERKTKCGGRSLTYKNRAASSADRNQKLRLLDLSDAVPLALRRDECGAWRVKGKHGYACTWGDNETWVAYLAPGSVRKWNTLKSLLSFCQLTQDGKDEGCLRFGPGLTPEEGDRLRKALGIRKRPKLSAEAREALRRNFSSSD
jgi:hypothetical protein